MLNQKPLKMIALCQNKCGAPSGHSIKYTEFKVVFYMFLLNLLEPFEI
jgi:hypothetical protein